MPLADGAGLDKERNQGDFKGKTVVITEAGNGIGEACAALFASAGANVFLAKNAARGNGNITNRNTPSPNSSGVELHRADLAQSLEIRAFFEKIRERNSRIDIIVSCFQESQNWRDGNPFDENAFISDVLNTGWPFFDILHCVYEVFASGPRYAIAVFDETISSRANVSGVSRPLVEVLSRYMAIHLRGENININVIRACRPSVPRAGKKTNIGVSGEEAARAAFTLCSGLLDAMSGQVLVVDNGLGCAGLPETIGMCDELHKG